MNARIVQPKSLMIWWGNITFYDSSNDLNLIVRSGGIIEWSGVEITCFSCVEVDFVLDSVITQPNINKLFSRIANNLKCIGLENIWLVPVDVDDDYTDISFSTDIECIGDAIESYRRCIGNDGI